MTGLIVYDYEYDPADKSSAHAMGRAIVDALKWSKWEPIDGPAQAKVVLKMCHRRQVKNSRLMDDITEAFRLAGIYDGNLYRIDLTKRHGAEKPSMVFVVTSWEEGGLATDLEMPPERTESPCIAPKSSERKSRRGKGDANLATPKTPPATEKKRRSRRPPKSSPPVAPKSSARRGKK